MAGSVQNNSTARYSLDNWKQLVEPREIELSAQFSVLVKPVDVMAFMTAGTSNPLLAHMQKLMKGAPVSEQQAGESLLNDPKTLATMTESLDKLLVEAVVEPPLREQGNEDGIPLAAIPFPFKLTIFTEMIGGLTAVQRTEAFPRGTIGGLEVGQDSEQIWQDAVGDDGDS